MKQLIIHFLIPMRIRYMVLFQQCDLRSQPSQSADRYVMISWSLIVNSTHSCAFIILGYSLYLNAAFCLNKNHMSHPQNVVHYEGVGDIVAVPNHISRVTINKLLKERIHCGRMEQCKGHFTLNKELALMLRWW